MFTEHASQTFVNRCRLNSPFSSRALFVHVGQRRDVSLSSFANSLCETGARSVASKVFREITPVAKCVLDVVAVTFTSKRFSLVPVRFSTVTESPLPRLCLKLHRIKTADLCFFQNYVLVPGQCGNVLFVNVHFVRHLLQILFARSLLPLRNMY